MCVREKARDMCVAIEKNTQEQKDKKKIDSCRYCNSVSILLHVFPKMEQVIFTSPQYYYHCP